jgi:hypothetical protein
MKHTPTPWDIQIGEQCCFHKGNRVSIVRWSDEGPDEVNCETVAEVWPTSSDTDIEDGKFIVKCVNMHDELATALRKATEWLRRIREEDETLVIDHSEDGFNLCDTEGLLAKLEGVQP